MPIAVDMNGGREPLSPTSPTRMTKAAFFRARSPPIEAAQSHHGNDLANRFDLQARIDPFAGRYTPESSSDGHALQPPKTTSRSVEGYASSVGASLGHTPPLDKKIRAPPSPMTSPTSPPGSYSGIGHAAMNLRDEEDEEERSVPGSSVMGFGEGSSDEMLMTLLAGQAAVDCEKMPVGAWEEVDSWKKELSLLSTRLESLVARHQREIKILTAARTLQKLNTANKRMSKQTMESLEQSEKRVEAAEKEVLVLRDRESSLRQRLMEHWAGVMAWEVRRLERVSAENQARYEKQARRIALSRAREEEATSKARAAEGELSRRAVRTQELEEMVVELGRRERAMEEEVNDLEQVRQRLEQERDEWHHERSTVDDSKHRWDDDRRAFDEERNGWAMEKRMLIQDREMVVKERAKAAETGRMSERDRANIDRVRGGLAGILGKKNGVGEEEMIDAVEEVKRILTRREDDVARLKEELREVNQGLEEEVRRVSADRDLWRGKAEQTEKLGSSRSTELAGLDKVVRNQKDQISDLQLRNESLSTSLQAAQSAVSSMGQSADSTKSLQGKIDALTTELDSIAGQFNEVWSILPHPSRRAEAQLVDPRTGRSNPDLASPSKSLDFAAVQRLYTPHQEGFSGIDEMLNRVRGLVDDGRLLAERCCRLGKERELLKMNAARAKKLAEDSRASLETYQRQVAVLEDRLAKSGASESKFLDELNSVRVALDAASVQKRQLEASAAKAHETCARLTEANDTLSARALSLAEDAEDEKRQLQRRLQEEIDGLKKRLDEAQEEADDGRTRGQTQRIQLLDEASICRGLLRGKMLM